MTLDVVRITEVRGSAFTAEMVISGRSGMRVIDCRPSDAIALALRHTLPVPIMATPPCSRSPAPIRWARTRSAAKYVCTVKRCSACRGLCRRSQPDADSGRRLGRWATLVRVCSVALW